MRTQRACCNRVRRRTYLYDPARQCLTGLSAIPLRQGSAVLRLSRMGKTCETRTDRAETGSFDPIAVKVLPHVGFEIVRQF